MKYIVMEIYDSYVILMDEKAGFVKAKNLGYELGQTIEEPVIIRGIDKYKGVITTVVACVTTMAAALVMVLAMAYYVGYNGTSDNASGGMNIEGGYTEPSGEEVNSTTIEAEAEEVDGETTQDKEEMILEQEETTINDIEDVTVEEGTIGIMLENEVKAIGLADAGYEEEDVRYIQIVDVIEDGSQLYELEFGVGIEHYTYRYEYIINAYNGDILEVESDRFQNVTGNVSQLEKEEIKQIVLADMKESGIDEDSVVFKRIQLWYNNDYVKGDENDALYKYSAKIKVDGIEYRYEMNAVTGKILKKIVK